ncbi:uncharacterized protein [Salminus brasiliensis]|uniref:uncharacterized protein n=1 Tax=Salminus brasiliensis TaxID=930266 RepID=UPI003B82FAF1
MDAGNLEAVADEADDTDELICTDVDGETVSEFDLGPPAVLRDHCDLLLDAIDAQLSHLQSHGHCRGGKNKLEVLLTPVCLDRSSSVSKDTGLGSADPSTDKASSTPDGSNSDLPDLSPVKVSRGRLEPAGKQKEGNEEYVGLCTTPSWQTGGAGVPVGSKSEQCLWRLQRLLGTTTRVRVKDQEAEEEDSVCTEDFSARFREEMLELQEPSAGRADSAPDATSICSDTGPLTIPQITQKHKTVQEPSRIRHLAGVPMRSFDSVTIDSDLDSVCTEQIWQHVQSTVNSKTAAAQMLMPSRSGRRKNSQQSENQALSSDDEGTVTGENGECVRCYRVLRAPASVQRREKKSQSRKKSSISYSTPSTTSKERQDDKLRTEFSDLELTLAGLQHQKAAVVQVVERLREEVEESEREQHTLQLSMTQTRTHTQLLRSELHKLQAQRDLCVKEVRALQDGQAVLQRPTCYYDYSPHRQMNGSCVSVLEREEMDRLLDSTKSELFSEQRRFRNKLDSLQERLEEVNQELEQKEEESRSLREKCSELEEKLTTAIKHREELQASVQSERVKQEDRLGALEKILAQKELLLLGMQEEQGSLQTELRVSREEHRAQLTAALAQAQKEKEEEVEQLKAQLIQTQEHELQMLKEQEVKRLQESVKQQQEVLKRREEELKREAQEQVKRAVEREQRKCEEQKVASLREQQRMLTEQMQEVERKGKAEAEREKRSALTLQNKVVELQTRVEELESEASVQTAKLRALKDGHQAELQRLRGQLKQEAEREAVRLKQCVKQSEKRLQNLKAALAEREGVHQRAAEKLEQQSTGWAQDIHTECVCLQELLTHNGLPTDTKLLPHSVTVSVAVQELQSIRKPLQHLIGGLQNRITSLTQTVQQLRTDKETELRLQREHLTEEKQRAVNSLREKLIQEHIEELSSMSRARLSEGDGDGAAASLRRQLQAKDEELRQVQKNMAQWKERTTTRLTQKFEDELERRVSKPTSEQQRRLELLEGEMRHLTRSYGDLTDVHLASASAASVPHLPSSPSSPDLASYKLLRHLQSRIRQLQADSQTHTLSTVVQEGGDLTGSYLETIPPVQERYVPRRSGVRTASNEPL